MRPKLRPAADRCHAHLISLFVKHDLIEGKLLEYYYLAMLHGRWATMRPKGKAADRCRAHLTFFSIFNWSYSSLITIILIRLSDAARSMGLLCARNCGKPQIAAVLT